MLKIDRLSTRIVTVLAACLMAVPTHAQAVGEPITPRNAGRVRLLSRIGDGYVNQANWSPDGTELAVASSIGLWLYPVSGPPAAPALLETSPASLVALAYRPDGARLVTTTDSSALQIRDGKSGKALQELKSAGSQNAPPVPTYSPDGTTLALTTPDQIELRSGQTNQRMVILQDPGHMVDLSGVVAISPDGRLLAAARSTSKIWLWDLSTQQPIRVLNAPNGTSIFSLQFSADSRQLLSGNSDGVRIWNVPNGKLLREPPHGQDVNGLTFARSGKRYAAVSGSRIEVRSVETDELSAGFTVADGGPGMPLFSPDEMRLATVAYRGDVRIWDLQTGDVSARYPRIAFDGFSVRYDSSGQLIAATDFNRVHVLNGSDGALIRTLRGPGKRINTFDISPDGRQIATGGVDSKIQLWDTANGENRLALLGHTGEVSGIAFSPDSMKLASTSADGTVRLWNAVTGDLLISGRAPIADGSLVFSPDGRSVALLDDSPLWILDAQTLSHVSRLDSPIQNLRVRTAAFSPDGQRIAAAGYLGMTIWDLATGKTLAAFPDTQSYLTSIQFSPDGQILAAVGTGGKLRLRDGGTFRLLATLDNSGLALLSIRFEPHGILWLTGARNGTLQIWGIPDR